MDKNGNLEKILIIDDEASIRLSFTDYLEDRNFKVFAAENGRIGLELIEKEHPDIILVDLRMPEIDGLEVLKQTRKSVPDTPKIVISGANRIGDVVRALRYGAWDYLVKPVKDLSILGHTVNTTMEKAKLLKENQDYQKHLEIKVQKRTHELEQANTRLANINARLKSIVETTQDLSACTQINQFSIKILEEFAHHMVASGGSIYFVEEKGLRLIHSLDPGHASEFIKFPLPENSTLNKVLASSVPLLVKDMGNCDLVEPSGWEGYKDGSLLAFPIFDGSEKIIGVLTLHSKKTPPFIEQDKEIGSILASYSCETLKAIQAFEKVQESEKLYRTLFERTNDAIFIIEKATGRCLDGNAAATRLTGRTFEELKNMFCKEIIPEGADDRLQLFQNLKKAKELGQATFNRPDNTVRLAKLSVVPLDDKAVISIARDITHDLEMEKQLRHSQKMEAIGTLAGGIAHDFNNILSSILGYAQLAKMTLDDPGKTQKSLDQMVQGAQRAAGLIQQILTFSKQAEHKKTPLKIFLIVKEAIKFLRSSIPTSIEIQDKIDSKASVLADPVQVHQVVMNLCTNAYHSMRDSGGVLMVELSEIEISPLEISSIKSYSPGLYLKLEVKDTGHGMDKETMEKIFDPYFSTKQPDKGTGLGLAVVNGIVKKHNGFIKAHSKINQGSSFQVFWPVIEKQEPFSSNGNEEADILNGTENIMLVDDEKDILNASQLILEKQGYKVTTFKEGAAAFEEFTKNPGYFDLIVTDMAMPKMTGSELSVKILNIRKDIPIILCTGYSESINKDMALKIGIKKYVQKPITVQDLSVHIRELLDA
ncbi:MAG: response regulator [Desulfobacula sp.]|nr:response regulator [Desulfobacula sp.]